VGTSIRRASRPVLVTGAAGSLGRRVVERLSPGWPVVALDRSPCSLLAPGVQHHTLDLALASAQAQLRALAEQAAAIVHLAWLPGGANNLTLTRNLLGALGSSGPGQLVHLSSATVYGAWPDNPVPLTEDVKPRPNPEFSYAVQKRAAEALVERWSILHSGTKVALLRPVCTVGAAGQPLSRALASPRRPPLSSPARMVQFLHLDDLAEAVAHVLAAQLEGTYNVAPDAGVSEEIAGEVAAGSASLPAPARAVLAAWDWRSSRLGLPPGAEAYVEHPWVVSPDKLQATGWQPQYSSAEALLVADGKDRWDDLPQGRRVAITLAVAGLAVVATGFGGAALWRSKH
jgi:nucleoside-diphosphate-sugar epimerase